MKQYLLNIFTSRDNETFSMSKLIGFMAAVTLIGEFIRMSSVDFQGFGVAIAALLAAFAAKSVTDK